MAELVELTRIELYQHELKDNKESSDTEKDSGDDKWFPSYWLVFTTFGPPAGENMSKIFKGIRDMGATGVCITFW